MDFRQGEKKDSVEFDYVFDATQGALSPSACGRERCWLFTENELQVFRLSGTTRGSRIFKWIFETPSGAEVHLSPITPHTHTPSHTTTRGPSIFKDGRSSFSYNASSRYAQSLLSCSRYDTRLLVACPDPCRRWCAL